jgi:hypothetical protein
MHTRNSYLSFHVFVESF